MSFPRHLQRNLHSQIWEKRKKWYLKDPNLTRVAILISWHLVSWYPCLSLVCFPIWNLFIQFIRLFGGIWQKKKNEKQRNRNCFNQPRQSVCLKLKKLWGCYSPLRFTRITLLPREEPLPQTNWNKSVFNSLFIHLVNKGLKSYMVLK